MFAPEYTPFISALGSFDYVSAGKHLIRITKAHPAAGALCNRLSHCESQYTSLQFLKPKIFRRDDLQILHGLYSDIVSDVERELNAATSSIPGSAAFSGPGGGAGGAGTAGTGAGTGGTGGTAAAAGVLGPLGSGKDIAGLTAPPPPPTPPHSGTVFSGSNTIGRAAGAKYNSTSPKITFDANTTFRSPTSQPSPQQQSLPSAHPPQPSAASEHSSPPPPPPSQPQPPSHPIPTQGTSSVRQSPHTFSSANLHHARGPSTSYFQHARERTSSSNITGIGGASGGHGSPGHHHPHHHHHHHPGRYSSSHESSTGEYLNRSPQAFQGYEQDELTAREYIALYTLIRELCGLRMTTIEIYRLLASSTVEIHVPKILAEAELARLMYDTTSRELQSTVLGAGVQHEIEILRHALLADKAITEYDLQGSAAHLRLARTGWADWRKMVVEQEYAEKSVHRRPEDTSWRVSSFFSAVVGGVGVGGGSSNTGSSSSGGGGGGGLHDDKKKKTANAGVAGTSASGAAGGGAVASASGKGGGGGLVPNHMQWLGQWMTSEKSKMTLYFMETLLEKEQVVGGDERSLWAGMDTDMHGMIRTFRKRAGAHSVSFVYEITPDVRFSRLGYLSASAPYTPPTGINSFPCIYSYPPDPPRDHWPNIISIIQGSSKILQQYRSQYFYDRKIGCTYYVARCDPHVSVVIIYVDKHPQPDSGAMEFLQMLAGKLRHTETLAALRME